jgi:hypothetical protein
MAGPGRAPGADTHNNKQGSRSIAQVDGPGDRPPQPNPQPRQNPFGGSVGYDPARDPHKSQQLEKTAAQVVGGRVDLPASAYKIAGKVVRNQFQSSIFKTLLLPFQTLCFYQ